MTRSAWIPCLALLLALSPASLAREGRGPSKAPVVEPFERPETLPPGPIDALVRDVLRDRGVHEAHACSDVVFVRRAYLDVIGTMPGPREVLAFLRDPDPGKRAALIDALMERDAFADTWTLKWCDLLRVKAEFPVNLWPNGVQAYARWIHESVRANKPYDRFVRELLTSSGSNFRVPPVNFYRAVQGKQPSALAAAVALTFMGARLSHWSEERRAGLEAFFSRVAFKGTAEWKEEIVFLDPAPAGPLDVVFPDGSEATIPPGEDPREAFADWLIDADNAWFARNIVNRVWSWLMGRGIIHEPDDIRPDNPPVNPALLDYLEWELVESGFDLRHLFRLILHSRTYQQSSIPRGDPETARALFACYPARQLDAEVLADALRKICGFREAYSSMIPEPFTFIPPENRCITLVDGSITGPFLEMFGRPSRDTGLESERNNDASEAQRMFLLNSSTIQKGLERCWWLKQLEKVHGKHPGRLVRMIYLIILSRGPTDAERSAVKTRFQGKKMNRHEAAVDLAWALINSKEFLYRH